MCGITGLIHLESQRKADRSKIKRMADSIAHRGPDGEGFYVNGPLALGHRRLSIIDLKTGDQPMFTEDKRLTIVYNGEIYNYIELREELSSLGHVFKTDSDTEVILNAYTQWGEDCQLRFNGMWAFAIWDAKNGSLFLSRDRLGEKPLHYALYDNSLLFGSEIKSLLAYGLPKRPDNRMTEIYLGLGYVPAPYSFYEGILKLEPGCCLSVVDGKISLRRYWELPDISEAELIGDRPKVNETFLELLTDSVRLRMRSDVPYGAFLSGGLDSSSLVAMMSDISQHPVETFTVGFENADFDERALARQVADKFGCRHHDGTITAETLTESLSRVLSYTDEPFGDSSAIATGYVAEYARKNVKMAITGDGGDEVLSGYSSYQSEKLSGFLHRFPRGLRKGIPSVIKFISRPVGGRWRYKTDRFINVLDSAGDSFQNRLLNKASWMDPRMLREIISSESQGAIHLDEYLEQKMAQCRFKDGFYRNMYYNFKLSLPEDMLVKVDRMAMSHSLETRAPFLDHRLVEYMYRVPKDIKMKGFQRKSILRDTVGKRLPEAVRQAGKKGFVVPLRDWCRDPNMAPALDDLWKTDWGLNQNMVKQAVVENANGTADNGNFIWMMLLLKQWMI
ncbi:MAG: asparagine synthase (glutamine-hydrolyzing) [Candidatus Edwardsbacteria bacterium RIFOXYD12_FULL_50_11]|uniref:asparagine synthase (glutamine-hydrolyzing) n=1 Tax=Candidatus Edwardsbacteria bacterium GWF2_54_11 TaxID=1817851 RepID=A0A1F5R151_9BACT|nr:MAG: asparagine synthase (glutamine-hydrolyzing) [Candidatus Edwardsbacteria bacterium RifOxyC12_full_54_24]OGF07867.1 MAG: asparagine synthase (glutamine-hydrolyzing) [Candidatus Edwardsbacteria bacterium RifOxyA12_full_54_48]OGF08139.1 MAG: asparagine synthase (glutamine-hydrolyzing) [Candidatus Edwardsbacteria bacterium GWF2_54_11]OGF10116.1 MAG: asparagine synthase (glutamine-hydrolyzing) [Candidatus Edwardsbacteria bacterium GWE2_54_12]OGF15027.1 MAG: asparagine synthase (glutamine-hydr